MPNKFKLKACPSKVTLVMSADVIISDFKSGGTYFNFSGDNRTIF